MTQQTLKPVSTGAFVPVAGEASSLRRFFWNFADTYVLMRRNLTQLFRQPQLLVFATIQPVMFLLLFTYVFGGAIRFSTGGDYISFLLPGVIIQTIIFASTNTTVGLSVDLSKGMIDRFRSLPMSRAAVLGGSYNADTVRGTVTITIMMVAGFVIGFRFENWASGFAGILLGYRFWPRLHLDWRDNRPLRQRSRGGAGGGIYLDVSFDLRQFYLCTDANHARLVARFRGESAS